MCETTLVSDIQKVTINEVERNFYSFATKYCSHHRPMDLCSGGRMRSISIEELRSEVEAYIEAVKSANGDSAVRYLNRAETALRSYDGVPERFKNTYFQLIEDIKNDLEQ